ncbi:unnamed protein product, partial [Strongylus vulgaris]
PTPGATAFGINFNEEREKCLANKVLFEDPEFPAAERSIYYKTPPDRHVEWKRPGEIVEDPQLIVGEKSRFDVKQVSFPFNPIFKYQENTLPSRVRLATAGFWLQWQTLRLEMSYNTIKLYGSYENLEGGTTAEALEDFTGGLTEFYNLRKTDKSTVLAMMIRGFQMGSLFGCSIDVINHYLLKADPHQKEAPLENGLVRGHAYSITALHTVEGPNGQTPIIRIRNPWGNSKLGISNLTSRNRSFQIKEWNGAWSDGSSEWNYVDSQKRSELGVNFANDGEFWMPFDDFYTNFMEMEVCNMSAAIMNEISEMTGVEVSEHQAHQWEEKAEDGEWSEAKGTAGGCANNPDSYARNPQFGTYFIVTEDSVEQDGKCTVIVAVLQKYRREMRTIGKDSLPIGFAVYQVTCRFRVPAGKYIIVPCTFDPGCDGEFLLRIYVNGKLQARSTSLTLGKASETVLRSL